MYQKDYILRMIEMIGEFIAAFLGYLKKGDYEKAAESLDNAYQDFLKNDAAFFQQIPKAKLTKDLLEDHNYTNHHLEVLAELFRAEGNLRYAQRRFISSLPFFEKSLLLFEFLEEERRTFSLEKQNKMNELKHVINEIKTNWNQNI